MDLRYALLLAICIAAAAAAGCANVAQAPVTPSPAPLPAGSPAVLETPHAGTTVTGCADDVCPFDPSLVSRDSRTSLRIEASPRRYSPMMSSTPGVGLTPNITGFDAGSAVFTWDASFGQFLSWDAPDYTVNQLGSATTNSGGKLYWTFIDKPSSTTKPVVITVSAKDKASGTMRGSSTVTLAWDGNYAVTVQDIQ